MSPKQAGAVARIRSAIENDDPDELNSLLVGRNPCKLRFPTGDGESHGIQTIAATLGAWKCLIALIDDPSRFANWRGGLDAKQLEKVSQDTRGATLAATLAMMNGIQGAIDYYRRILYWGYRTASPQERKTLADRNEGNEHFAHARSQVHAEEEQALFSIGVAEGTPSAKKRRGLDG